MEGLLTFTTVALAGLALYTVQNLIRYVKAGLTGESWNGALAIALSFAGGLVIAEWMAHASITAKMQLIVGAPPLGDLDFGSLALLAIGLGSVAPSVADFFKSRDNNDSSAKPKLVG